MEGWFGPKNQKLSHGGLVLGEGNPIMTGYAGIKMQRGHKKGSCIEDDSGDRMSVDSDDEEEAGSPKSQLDPPWCWSAW